MTNNKNLKANEDKLEKRLTDFDPDLSPLDPINQEAAQQRGLVFDFAKRSYIDEDGCLIKDEYGQSLG